MELRLVLFGYTGAGKSATGNMILGKRVFETSASGSSDAFRTEYAKTDIDGRQVVIVDTPGLFDTRRGNEDTLREITRCVCLSSPGPHALILVVQGGRVSEHIQESAQILVKAFGDNAVRHLIVLFTRCDDLEDDCLSVEDYAETLPAEMKRLLDKCGNRYLAFNNRTKSKTEKQAQVRELMAMVDQMVADNRADNNSPFYSNDVYKQVEEAIPKQKRQEIQNDKGERGGIIHNITPLILGVAVIGGAVAVAFSPIGVAAAPAIAGAIKPVGVAVAKAKAPATTHVIAVASSAVTAVGTYGVNLIKNIYL